MKTRFPATLLLLTLSCPWLLAAQGGDTPARLGLPTGGSASEWLPKFDPSPIPAPAPDRTVAASDTVPLPVGPAQAAPALPPPPTFDTPPPAPAASATPAPVAESTGPGIRLNFQGAQLSEVLNYLSEAAGFVIVQDVPVTGTVNIISRQSMTPDEAVDLLNTVLLEKNYIALRNGRILKIVSRTDAQKRDLPVITGADPAQIPRKDTVVTQILPVRYADVSKLIDNLRPLLADNASISANDASNAIILTDSQTNVRRMAEIIRALDTSISGISTIHVFSLRYADAKGLADVITQLFQPSQSSTTGGRQGGGNQGGPPNFGGFGGPGGGFGGGFGGGRRGGGGGNAEPQSEARAAASRVVAVADQTSNSVIVSAPDEFMPSISEVVSRLDTSLSETAETRIFRLLHADASELGTILTTLYGDPSTSSAANGGNNNNRQGQRNGGGGGQQNQAAALSPHALLEARMVAVADPRTNSIIVTASHNTMEEVALTVGRLDASDSKKQHIHVYTLQNADPDNVAGILRGMFTVNGSLTNTTQSTTDVLNQRTSTGASSDVINTLDTNSGAGRTGNGR